MDLQFSEDTKCNNRKKCTNQLNIFPIYTVAFSYSEVRDKTFISEDSNDFVHSINNETASSSTLKNKRSVEVNKSNTNNAINITERPVISVNNIIDITETSVVPIKNTKDYFVNVEYGNNNHNNARSEPLPSSIKYIKKPVKTKQRSVFSTLKSKPKKITRLVKIKSTHFKNKSTKNIINKNLETYYDRAKTKCPNAGKIHRKIYSDSILNAVSLTRILKKVLAKENLLDNIDKISLNGNHNEDNISYVSESSQHTLTNERSFSTDNSDFNNTKTTPSVINVSNDMTISNQIINFDGTRKDDPYKTDIIAVAVARIENASILNYKQKSWNRNDREKFITKDSLISTESCFSYTDSESCLTSFEITHNPQRKDHLTIDINDSGVSCQTLTERQNVFNLTSESDHFVIAKNSSYFKKDPMDSNMTLTPLMNLKNKFDVQLPKHAPPKLLKSTLLDTIINVSMIPKITTSAQDNLYNSELKDIIITEELRKSLPLNRLDNDYTNENKYPKSIFKKSCLAEDDSNHQKSIYLPNEDTIKELLYNRDEAHKKSCSEEFRNYTAFSELWDKLTIFLDLAMKKLEDAITDKITQEMKKYIERLDKIINTSLRDSKVSKSETYLKRKSQETNIISTVESVIGNRKSKSFQCGSIENNVLDELIKKINHEALTQSYKSSPLRLKDKICKSDSFFEVFKPALASRASNDQGNGESILVSSSEAIEVICNKLQYLPSFMITGIRVFKENLLVITSVPLFCFAVFLIYTFLAMLADI